ncbi:MAG: acyl-CoA dehydrogenase family protein [Chloroflexota bacterium]|nr:acyl-CoA dehydrogenase family protein [Chloroflexota bacterium]
MDVLPGEEEQMVKNLAREFLEAECPPSLAREMEKDDLGYPPDLWRKISNLGWFGMSLPESYGGQGLPITYLGLIAEELGRAIAPVPFHSTVVAALTLASHGTESQKQSILPKVSSGDMVLSWAFQELNPKLIPDAIQTTATETDDGYVINGTKMFVDNFGAADNCIVTCRTSPPSLSNEGLSMFIINTKLPGISNLPLVTIAKDKQSKVTFDQVKLSKESLVGELDQGWPVAQEMLDKGAILLCAQMVGAARKDIEIGIEYTKNRVAFGRPIGAFQSVQHMCADMTIWVDGAQMLTYEALWKMDHGIPAGVDVSQAKAFCNDKCQAAVRSCQVLHGGMGFMMEFDLHLWYRRVCAWTMRLGTSFEHRARVSKALIEEPGRVRLGMNFSAVK